MLALDVVFSFVCAPSGKDAQPTASPADLSPPVSQPWKRYRMGRVIQPQNNTVIFLGCTQYMSCQEHLINAERHHQISQYFWPSTSISILQRHYRDDCLHFQKLLFWEITISNVDISGSRQVLEDIEKFGKFRKWYHFTVMPPIKPRKDNTCATKSKILDNVVLYHNNNNTDVLPSPRILINTRHI